MQEDPRQMMPSSQIPQPDPNNPNPFAMEQFARFNQLPDTPIQYGGGIADALLNDNEVPDDERNLKKRFWYVFHKDNVLTFLDEERKDMKLLNFDIVKIDLLNDTPYYEYTFEKELEFNIMRTVLETKLDRALGVRNTNVKNERIVLQSQFSEQRQISENDSGDIKSGFFKRLLGRR
jgi:hypothetical protein